MHIIYIYIYNGCKFFFSPLHATKRVEIFVSLWLVWKFRERGEYRGMLIHHLVWMFLKLVRGKGVISRSSYLDVLKIMMEMRRNDLNRQIYPYLKMDLQHWSMINLLD